MDSAQQSTKTALNSYNALLTEMEQITDSLSSAVLELRLSDMEQLLGCREVLCNRITSTRHEIRRNLGGCGFPEQTRQLEQIVLAKQAACESTIAENLRQCRTDLADLRKKKGLRQHYGPANPTAGSSFLDNRI